MKDNYKITQILKTDDGIEYIAKSYNSKAKDNGDRILEFIVSDEKLDRDEEKILLSAWKLEKYSKPIVLQNHVRNGNAKAVAKIVRLWKDQKNKQLKAKIQFPTSDLSSEGDSLYKLYRGGYMEGISPGFIPVRDKMIFGEKKGDPRITYTEIEDFFELSLVTVPANPRATVQLKSLEGVKRAMQDGIVDELEIKDLEIFMNEEIKNNKNINSSSNNFDSEIIDKDIETEKLSNNDLIIGELEEEKIKSKNNEVIKMPDKKEQEFSVDDIVNAVEKRFEERQKEEAEKRKKENELKALKEENEKLKKEQEEILKAPATKNLKNFANEKKHDIEVGEADEFMGFKMRAQGRNFKLKGLNERQLSEAKRYVISKFAPLSSNPHIQKSAQINTTSYSAGIPEELHQAIILKAEEGSVFAKCRRFNLERGRDYKVPVESSAPTLHYAGEGTTLTIDTPSASSITLQPKKLGLAGKLTKEALDQVEFDVFGFVGAMATKAHRNSFDDFVFNGESTGNSFTGILGNATTSVIFGENNGATSYASMTASNWRDLIFSLTAANRIGAEVYMGKAVRAKLQSLPTVSGGAFLFINPQRPNSIEGYPIVENEQIDDTDASSTVFACFGNLDNYALGIGPSDGIQVNPMGGETEFFQDVILFRYRVWAAGKMIFASAFADIGTQ